MRSLLLVHAHPDDECISTGGTIAHYAQDGVRVCLVTCTDGQLGEIAEIPELGSVDEIRPRLGEIRRRELQEALGVLGPVDARFLGYHDSGMARTEWNHHPDAFVNQPLAEVAERIAAVIREVRPQVLVTYNEYGFYGHPDHIRAHEAAMNAVELAADGSEEAYRVAKVYYTAVPRSSLRAAREIFPEDGPGRWEDEEIERIGTADELITTALDVSGYVEAKVAALYAHRTQLGTTGWFFSVPEDFRTVAFGTEHYVLARSELPRPTGIEADLFEGLGEGE